MKACSGHASGIKHMLACWLDILGFGLQAKCPETYLLSELLQAALGYDLCHSWLLIL
jgi:hypothetical protein